MTFTTRTLGLAASLGFGLLSLSACTQPMNQSAAMPAAQAVPQTSSARGVVDPNARPNPTSSVNRVGPSPAIGQSTTAGVPMTGAAQGVRVPNAR